MSGLVRIVMLRSLVRPGGRDGQAFNVGETYDVDSELAEPWVSKGVAEEAREEA